MPAATQVFTSFLGGEISKFAQGRYDRPDYRTSMRTCLNSLPIESGAWTRRPGTQYAGHTKGGAPGRVVKFDFEQSNPITMEFTDGWLRFRNGAALVPTDDEQVIIAISSAVPAVVETTSAHGWSTGNTVVFSNLSATAALLQNRQFKITEIDSTHFSLQETLTGANIDGSTVGALGSNPVVSRVQEVATPYAGGSWADVRVVQAETTDILLCGSVAPQALEATTGNSPTFALSAAIFLDGPYLDPFTNGVQATPSATSGIVALSLSFQAYSSTVAYTAGAFVAYSGVNYESLVDQNVGNQPDTHPSQWAPVSVGTAINSGRGFLGSDIGRLVRLLSEPAPWNAGTAYPGAGNVVSYNPSGIPGATTYWQSLTATTGNPPGSDLTHWEQIPQGAALWSWGRITSLSTIIDRSLVGSIPFGDMTGGGGVSSVFNGVFSQPSTAGAAHGSINHVTLPGRTLVSLASYVGKDYSASPQQIKQATVYPTTDVGFSAGTYLISGAGYPFSTVVTLNLRAKNSGPTYSSDGTLLGTSGEISNTFSAVTILSNDPTTSWKYVWVEMIVTALTGFGVSTFWSLENTVAQLSLFSPTGTGTGTGVDVEILGPALLYTNTITTWRLGVYSDTTGWPTCGCYDGGRLFLGGAVPNRWDACYANGIDGSSVNFAPTDQYGVVSAANAISYTFNSDSVNPIMWMMPDLQGVLMGTQAGEWLVRAPTSGALSPTNVDARRVTKIGCANVEPRRTEHTIVFVKRYGRKLMEYFADVYSGKFSAPNLSDKAQHIPRTGIAELAYTEAVNSVIWGRCTDGSLFGITYRRDNLASSQGPTHYAWHPHALGSGRTVESICGGPSTGGDLDSLTMVTNDSSTNIRHVEILTDTPDELTDLASSWFLDDAVNPASVSFTNTPSTGAPRGGATLNGLWHLNGETVQVFAGGLDCGDRGDNTITDYVVTDGSVFVPFGDGVNSGPGQGLFTVSTFVGLDLSDIVVGFTYNSDGQVVRLIGQSDTGARNGPALGAPSRTHRAAIKFVNSKGASIGGNFDRLYPCLFRASIDSPRDLPTLSTYTGIFFDQVRDDFTYDDSLCWRVSRPFPATITACAQNLRTEDM